MKKSSENQPSKTPKINLFWFRRDLRLEDNAGLYNALKSDNTVLPIFIFDKNILDKLPKTDARVTFIYQTIVNLKNQLNKLGSDLLVEYGVPEEIWKKLVEKFDIETVYTNHDYEPYAKKRDSEIAKVLKNNGIDFKTFKDQVIFEKDEVVKSDGKPYTVFTPYFKIWQQKLNDFYIKEYPTKKYFKKFAETSPSSTPFLKDMGFEESKQLFPSANFEEKLASYEKRRDYPADDATSRIGLHLRFGTVSIRNALATAIEKKANKWISELAWRDFYMMILWHFPQTQNKAFKPAYDNIEWRNNEKEFKAWCNGETGYPLVDAGMKQLNESGFMHNRVRMVVASFLCKHLLIDWRWGETYFAEKLLDYEMASNVGGWQWACGSGNDAAPYFRVFNPELQLKKFDPKMEYVFKWAPEYKLAILPVPIVEHTFARDRVLKAFKKALA
ncbi:cryptochrome/photolyase family protein [Pedobacter namyangjuensis]|uniref:cryptochrome/photolyase family protein n=1 Tax=Pedobacter namyangjuensis TaxID=600626 RepID=UPI000DE3FC7F|nr:deoxyribodipyrimidine photo-lyase [Pedobacter namyangjuensis]